MCLCNFKLWDRSGPCSEGFILVILEFDVLDTLAREILDFKIIISVCVSVSHILDKINYYN